jgi:hypothetical protein
MLYSCPILALSQGATMFHPDFRPRLPVHNPPESAPRIDVIDVPDLHMRIASALDAQIASGRAALEVSDDLAALLSAALQQRRPSEVNDPLEIYEDLLLVSSFVLRDLYNHFLADEYQPCVRDPELKGAAS